MKDLTGTVFGRLTVLRFSHKKQKHYYYICLCECGKVKAVRSDQLTRGITKSCGCLHNEISRVNMAITMYRHGMTKHPLNKVLSAMKQRCYNPNIKQYKDYGGRGICICEEWLNNRALFYQWAIENGYKRGLTIDRIDVNGDYTPNNCRIVTMNEQCRNKRCNIVITYKGQTKILADWCMQLQLSYNAIYARLERGWSVEKAFTTPIRKLNKRNSKKQ